MSEEQKRESELKDLESRRTEAEGYILRYTNRARLMMEDIAQSNYEDDADHLALWSRLLHFGTAARSYLDERVQTDKKIAELRHQIGKTHSEKGTRSWSS